MKKFAMKKETTRLAASMVIVASLGAYLWSPWFLVLNLFVGLNMLQFTFTNWCLAEKIMEKMNK